MTMVGVGKKYLSYIVVLVEHIHILEKEKKQDSKADKSFI